MHKILSLCKLGKNPYIFCIFLGIHLGRRYKSIYRSRKTKMKTTTKLSLICALTVNAL